MKMFLTRLGFDSKAVITGDVTQIDLPSGRKSGLVEVNVLLNGIEGIGFAYLTKHDIVRHPLVQKIVAAYEDGAGKNGLDSQRAGKQQARPGNGVAGITPIQINERKNTRFREKTR